MRAVLIAGGLGTRLAPFTDNNPKLLVPLRGRPLLLWQVEELSRQGADEIILCIGHMSEKIIEFARGNLARQFPKIKFRFSVENEALGTGGALKKALGEFGAGQDDFIVTYGDIFFRVDVAKMLEAHRRSKCAATALVRSTDHPHDSDIVELENGKITKIIRKGNWHDGIPPIANASFFIFSPGVAAEMEGCGDKFSMEHDLFERLVKKGGLCGYLSDEVVRDVGTWERIRKVEGGLDKL